MFLEDQISIFKWFLKDHVTLKNGVMAVEYSALLSQEYYILQLPFEIYSKGKMFVNKFISLVNNDCWKNVCEFCEHSFWPWVMQSWHTPGSGPRRSCSVGEDG